MKDPNVFITDFSVKGMLHALTIRSPIARGTLKEIICPKLPDSFYLITAEQIPGENCLADFPARGKNQDGAETQKRRHPVLADKEISYIGQPLAILAGPDESRLEDLASLIEISAEEEPAVFSGRGVAGEEEDETEEIIVRRGIKIGEEVPAENEKSVSGTYRTGIDEHWYPEPHGAAALPSSSKGAPGGKKKGDELFEIYSSTQWPFHVKRSVAGVLGWEAEKIRVMPTLMTPHLDGKIWYPSLVACHAALSAWVTKRPVKLMLTREEDFLYSPKRNGAEIKIQSRLGEKGELLSSSLDVKLDLGSAGFFEDEIMDHTCLGSLGLYRHPALSINASGIRTNIAPQGPMAGFGLSQGFFAAERQISRIADSLGEDPAEWRKKNFLKKNEKFAIGTVLKDTVPLPELIDAAASMSDYYRKWVSYELLRGSRREEKSVFPREPWRGIGISTACQGSGFLYNQEGANYTVELTLEKDGFLEIKTSLVSSGYKLLDTWQNPVREILGVDPAFIRLTGNTDGAPDSGPGTLSRNIGSVTKLIERCCQAIRRQRFRDPLPITVKRSSKPARAPGWVPDKDIDPEAFAHPSWGTAIVEVEIDPVSLTPIVRGIWLAVDGGKIISQRRARRRLTGGIIQALSWTCRDQLHYEAGKIPVDCFRAYSIPSPGEIPPIFVDFIWNNNAGPKGIGDLPFSCVPAAYVQAVSQAVDHPFEKIPMGVHEIWDALKQKQTELSQ